MYISKVLKPFLVKYQTDEPMIMYVWETNAKVCEERHFGFDRHYV